MTKSYNPRPGISLTKLKSCAETYKELQQRVKQNIINVIAVSTSTHNLKKLSRPKRKFGNFPGAWTCTFWIDGSCLYSTETNGTSSYSQTYLESFLKIETKSAEHVWWHLSSSLGQLWHFWNNILWTFQTQWHHLKRLPKSPKKIKKKKKKSYTPDNTKKEWGELKFMVDTNQLWVKLITYLWLETYVEACVLHIHQGFWHGTLWEPQDETERYILIKRIY